MPLNENNMAYSADKYEATDEWAKSTHGMSLSDYLNKNPQLKNSGGGSLFNPQSAIDLAVKKQQEAAQPAIQSLQSSIPEVQQKYAQSRAQLQAQQQPLEQRYSDLLNSIKGNQQTAENRQTVTTNNELGKRGITASSGIAQQEMTNALNPITQQYTGMYNQTGLEREDALRGLRDSIANLTPQETADQRAIQNAIAQLQSGANQQGIVQGLNLYSQDLDNQFRQQQFAEQQKQNALENALREYQLSQSKINDSIQTKLLQSQLNNTQQLRDPFSEWFNKFTGNTNEAFIPKEQKPTSLPNLSSGGYMSTNSGSKFVPSSIYK